MKVIRLRAIDLERLGIEIHFVNSIDKNVLQECADNAHMIEKAISEAPPKPVDGVEKITLQGRTFMLVTGDEYGCGKCVFTNDETLCEDKSTVDCMNVRNSYWKEVE